MASMWSMPVSSGYTDAAAITPSDTLALARPCEAFFVGTGGTVTVVTASGNTVPFANVPSGTTVRLALGQVKATGTSATGIVALY